MKKLVLMSSLILAIIFVTATTNAQSTQSQEKAVKAQTTQTAQQPAGNFVDKDSDGICDNHQTRGKLDKCAKFVDGNGDGVCDNCKGTGNCGQANCCDRGMQKQHCQGMNKGNCCEKGKGRQHRHGQQGTTPQPEKN